MMLHNITLICQRNNMFTLRSESYLIATKSRTVVLPGLDTTLVPLPVLPLLVTRVTIPVIDSNTTVGGVEGNVTEDAVADDDELEDDAEVEDDNKIGLVRNDSSMTFLILMMSLTNCLFVYELLPLEVPLKSSSSSFNSEFFSFRRPTIIMSSVFNSSKSLCFISINESLWASFLLPPTVLVTVFRLGDDSALFL